MESLTAQIDFTHWHKCYPLARTFLTFRPQVSLSQRQITSPLGKADQEKICLHLQQSIFHQLSCFPVFFQVEYLRLVHLCISLYLWDGLGYL